MKKSFCVTMVLFLLLMSMVTGYAANPIRVFVDMKPVIFDVQPYLDSNNSVIVPVRFVTEELGGQITWDSSTQTVTIIKDTNTILLKVGDDTAYLNGSECLLASPAVINNGRVCIPVRFVSEILGADVKWDYAKNRVYIQTELSKKLVVNGKEIVGIENADIIPYFNQVDKVFKNSGYKYTQFYDGNTMLALNLLTEGTDVSDYRLDLGLVVQSSLLYKVHPYTIDFGNGQSISKNAEILCKEVLKIFYPTGYETIYANLYKLVNDSNKGNIDIVGNRYIEGTFDGRTYRVVVYKMPAGILKPGITIGSDN